jgi:hypothetical protein
MMEQGVWMGASWPLTWHLSGDKKSGFIDFIDSDTGEASPSKHLFKWFSEAADGILLNSSSSSEDLSTTAVLNKDGNTILVYLLNKSEESRNVSVKLRKIVSSVLAAVFQEGSSVGDAVVTALPVRTEGQTIVFNMTNTSSVFLKISVE